jgi:hypothetical protein
MRAWNRRVWATWILVLAFAELRGALTAASDHSWVPAVIAPAVFVVLIIPLSLYAALRTNRSLRLEAVSPEAVRAIRDGLAAAGLPVPDQIVVAARGNAAVRFDGFPRRRGRLYLALPPLLALSGSDLPVLAAHAMAVGQVTAYPVAAQRLWHKRTAVEVRRKLLERRGKLTRAQARRLDGFLAATETFARDVRARSDQAAVAAAAGSVQAAAQALYAEETVNLDYFQYASRFHRLIARKRRVPASIYSGWFARWSTGPEWLQGATRYPVDDFRKRHAGFAAVSADDLAAHISSLRAGRAGLPATSLLSPATTNRLARNTARQFAPGASNIRAVDGEKIDLSYIYDTTPDDDAVLEAATTLLHRPANRVDVADLLRDGRAPELAALLLTPEEQEDDDVDGGLSRGMVFVVLVSSALKERGMLQLDPYREWDFTGPDGDTIDAGQVVAEAMSPGGDTDDLYALLRG